jgi:hypothetical protein
MVERAHRQVREKVEPEEELTALLFIVVPDLNFAICS